MIIAKTKLYMYAVPPSPIEGTMANSGFFSGMMPVIGELIGMLPIMISNGIMNLFNFSFRFSE